MGVYISRPHNTGIYNYRPHQIKGAEESYEVLKKYGLVYRTDQERSGKSATAVLLVEKTSRQSCLILTRKQAIPGWIETLNNFDHGKDFQVINYESVHKIEPDSFDIVILDESHSALGKYPKPSKTFLKVAKMVYGLPLIYLSATPYSESLSQIYHQLRLSPWSPFAKYTNFYKWHTEYGIEEVRYLSGRAIKMYNKTQEDRITEIVAPIMLGVTRKEIGFEYEAVDKVHTIKLDQSTQDLIDTLTKDRVLKVQGYEVLAETVMSMLIKAYQIIGGTLKIEVGMKSETQKDYVSLQLGNTEKIQAIKDIFGDTDDLVIMYHFKEEERLLKSHFTKALILQATSYAEGISLKHKKHLVIYSMDFRTSKFIQRRNRQCDMTRDEEIIVHYFLTEKGIDRMVYEAVAEKGENFNAIYYKIHGM